MLPVMSATNPVVGGSAGTKTTDGVQGKAPQRQELPVSGNAAPVQQELPTVAVSAQAPVELTNEQMDSVVKHLKEYVDQAMGRVLNIRVDHDTGIAVIKIIDSTTNEIIRQIPSEELVAMVKRISAGKGIDGGLLNSNS
ncbi:MAG: flagellar protein FlaG [Gammaproteobacteria bacterium]|nr:flagellar protein FlaG [Gammaproteobacteria bacterium]